ncbi:Sodium channel protein Nach [Gryllus bimaculatus]|nr:Sodium channel protein Nach [Gryllus bimaculatus]
MIGITGEDFDDIDCTLMMGEIVFFEGVCTFCKNDDSHLQKLKEDYYHLSQNLFLHAPDSIPHWTTSESMRTTVKRGELIEHIIKVIDTTNDNEVHELPPEQRQCNLPKEIDKHFLYPFYSHSACAIACRSRHTMKICNCTLHFLPQTSQLKNMKIRSDVPPDGEEEDCFCPPSCSESEYQYISKPLINYESPNKDWAIVKIKLAYLPSERFTRRVICGKLDFAGGVGGLLLGASLLSLIEIVHFLFLRPLMNLCQKLGSHH